MSKRSDKDTLDDMHEAAQRIALYTAGMMYEAFLNDTKTQDAVVRNMEILGEAAKKRISRAPNKAQQHSLKSGSRHS